MKDTKKSHIISNLNIGDSPNQIDQFSNKELNLTIIKNNRAIHLKKLIKILKKNQINQQQQIKIEVKI